MLLKKIGYFHGLNKGSLSYCLSSDKINYPKEKVLSYLKSGVQLFSWLMHENCMYFCVSKNIGGVEYSDGKWVWTSEFIHYIEIHDIVIPEFFLNYLESQSYVLKKSEELLQLKKIDGDHEKLEQIVNYSDQEWKEWLFNLCPDFGDVKISHVKSIESIKPVIQVEDFKLPDDWE